MLYCKDLQSILLFVIFYYSLQNNCKEKIKKYNLTFLFLGSYKMILIKQFCKSITYSILTELQKNAHIIDSLEVFYHNKLYSNNVFIVIFVVDHELLKEF